MVNRNVLIGKVSPFMGKREIIVGNQDTTDIIEALINNHYKYTDEYNKIFRYFDGGSVEETMFNVWQFLKDDFKYTIEPENMQILRSPAALLASNIVGIDCKGYSTFINGILDSYRRNTGKDFEVIYRFASYDPFDKTPQHVFAVVKENGYEYWVDPVLDQFDERKQPYFYKDKKIKNMALVAMSGVPNIAGNDTQNNYGQINGLSTDLFASQTPWWEVLINKTPDIILSTQGKSSNQGQQGGGYDPYGGTPPPPASSGISTTTVLMIVGAAGLAAYFLLGKKK